MIREITKGIYSVGSNHRDRKVFDELIPLPDGTTYNSYLIQGEKHNVLIDAVDPVKSEELIRNLKKLNIPVHYIVSHHAEQDHSGAIPDVLKSFPDAKVLTNEKCKSFLMDLLFIPEEKFIVVKDREKFDIGGRTLEFIFTPWVHWPETMVTYLIEEKMLFSCDFFGSHYGTDDITIDIGEGIFEPAKRYYAEIMMPFRSVIKNNIKKLREYEIKMILPSHGPIHKNPDFIINAYEDWISDNVKNKVIIPYVSMHGSVKNMVDYLSKKLDDMEIPVKTINLSGGDIGELAIELVDAATVILAVPTMLVNIHPVGAFALYLLNALKPKTRFIGLISSYGWGGNAVEFVKSQIPNLKAELLQPVLIKGNLKDDDKKLIDALAENILNKHREIKII
uniref:FprA family A-type flavoprotein n=1 Tax=candidate division WOR-3 bacterium TaxID=2052148 RepID=A0A7C4U848_UNCW3